MKSAWHFRIFVKLICQVKLSRKVYKNNNTMIKTTITIIIIPYDLEMSGWRLPGYSRVAWAREALISWLAALLEIVTQ